MNIIKHNWAWRHELSRRPYTNALVLHHAAAVTASAADIHRAHLAKGWAGIGYHFYVRKDGSVHEGRPLWASGAHVLNHNGHTIGVCAEGNYETERDMPAAQLKALREVVAYVRQQYPGIAVKRHSDYVPTACPGRYFPFDDIGKEEADLTEADVRKIVREVLSGADTQPSTWAAQALAEAKAAGITDGTRPRGYATREECAVMVQRAVSKMEERHA